MSYYVLVRPGWVYENLRFSDFPLLVQRLVGRPLFREASHGYETNDSHYKLFDLLSDIFL